MQLNLPIADSRLNCENDDLVGRSWRSFWIWMPDPFANTTSSARRNRCFQATRNLTGCVAGIFERRSGGRESAEGAIVYYYLARHRRAR